MQKIYQILYFESADKLDEMRKEIEHMQDVNLDVELKPFDKGILVIGRVQKPHYYNN
jgi:hypothetical protein